MVGNPVFAPYIHIDYSKRHCAHGVVKRENAMATFRNKSDEFKSAESLSIHQYVLYRRRFAMDSTFRSAFDRYGGDVAQLNNLSIVMQIAIVGYPNIAMLYGDELRNRLSKYARERTPPVDYFQMLAMLRADIAQTVLQRASHTTTRRPPVWNGVKKRKAASAIKLMVNPLKVGRKTYR